MKELISKVPGFRSGKLWKKVIASIFYFVVFIRVVALMSPETTPQQSTLQQQPIQPAITQQQTQTMQPQPAQQQTQSKPDPNQQANKDYLIVVKGIALTIGADIQALGEYGSTIGSTTSLDDLAGYLDLDIETFNNFVDSLQTAKPADPQLEANRKIILAQVTIMRDNLVKMQQGCKQRDENAIMQGIRKVSSTLRESEPYFQNAIKLMPQFGVNPRR